MQGKEKASEEKQRKNGKERENAFRNYKFKLEPIMTRCYLKILYTVTRRKRREI